PFIHLVSVPRPPSSTLFPYTTLFRSHPRHIPIGAAPIGRVRPQVVRDDATVMRNDGNNVDIEREMAINAAAELQYAALTQVTSARYKMMRSAITQGGR